MMKGLMIAAAIVGTFGLQLAASAGADLPVWCQQALLRKEIRYKGCDGRCDPGPDDGDVCRGACDSNYFTARAAVLESRTCDDPPLPPREDRGYTCADGPNEVPTCVCAVDGDLVVATNADDACNDMLRSHDCIGGLSCNGKVCICVSKPTLP